jgi:hypothetical protein
MARAGKFDLEDLNLNFDQSNDLELSISVIRVLRYLMQRIKLENRKSWNTVELIKLLETMSLEITSGVTEEDKLRLIHAKHGAESFKAGKQRADNPFKRGMAEHQWWDIGWHDAEREHKTNTGGAVKFQQGRATQEEETQSSVYYRIRLIAESQVLEWSEALHQYMAENQGTAYAEQEEARVRADQLKVGAKGIVSVVECKE